jgi:hypothetical protein
MRVERLETWAGPGQNEVLSLNLRALRADVITLRRVQNQHTILLGTLTGDVSRLKDDVAGLKDDVAELRRVQSQHTILLGTLTQDVSMLKDDVSELKVAVQEILRRLPPAPAA